MVMNKEIIGAVEQAKTKHETSANTKFYSVIEALDQIDPRLAKLADLPDGGGKYVLLAEASNWAGKQAKAKNIELKATGDKEGAKKFDDLSGLLMGAAKNHLLPLALKEGAVAQLAKDDEGKDVVLLQHPDAGLIALHQVNVQNLPPATAAKIQPSGDLKFTGVKRQPLALLTAQSLGKEGSKKDLADAVIRASVDKEFADKVKASMGTMDVAASPKTAAKVLLRNYRSESGKGIS